MFWYETIFIYVTYIVYLLFIITAVGITSFLGISKEKSHEYLHRLDYFRQIYIGITLLLVFNPWSNVKHCTQFHKKIDIQIPYDFPLNLLLKVDFLLLLCTPPLLGSLRGALRSRSPIFGDQLLEQRILL